MRTRISLNTDTFHAVIIAQININSSRNMFDALVSGIQGNMDILMVLETKLDDSVPTGQFIIKGFKGTNTLDRKGSGSRILIYVREDKPSN